MLLDQYKPMLKTPSCAPSLLRMQSMELWLDIPLSVQELLEMLSHTFQSKLSIKLESTKSVYTIELGRDYSVLSNKNL